LPPNFLTAKHLAGCLYNIGKTFQDRAHLLGYHLRPSVFFFENPVHKKVYSTELKSREFFQN
jgi:hypothetical protein